MKSTLIHLSLASIFTRSFNFSSLSYTLTSWSLRLFLYTRKLPPTLPITSNSVLLESSRSGSEYSILGACDHADKHMMVKQIQAKNDFFIQQLCLLNVHVTFQFRNC